MTNPTDEGSHPPPPARRPARAGSGLSGAELRLYWRRYRKWLLLLPVVFFVGLTVMYDSVVMGFTAPAQIIAAPRGLEILDRNGELLYTFNEQPGASQVTPYDQISPDLIK